MRYSVINAYLSLYAWAIPFYLSSFSLYCILHGHSPVSFVPVSISYFLCHLCAVPVLHLRISSLFPVCIMCYPVLSVCSCFFLLYVNNHILICAYTCTCILSCVFSLQIFPQSFAIIPVSLSCKLFLNFFSAVSFSLSMHCVCTENYF